MTQSILSTAYKSVGFYKKPVIYQALIITLLSAVITGSLLTGNSVRSSLKRSADERLGNAAIVISSGIRSFSSDLPQRLSELTGVNCTGIYELNAFCQGLSSQKGAFNARIIGIDNNFFRFNGNDSLKITPGEIAVNRRLAEYLGVKPGDDLILRFREISDIPADAPFSPAAEAGRSVVMRLGKIIDPSNNGNFSLAISQIVPLNIFINLSDLEPDNKLPKINRLLLGRNSEYSLNKIFEVFKNTLTLSDIGLRIRKIDKTGEFELLSDRIFIDNSIIDEIRNKLPSSAPVITYLGNRFISGLRSTPYSFISALPSSLYPEIVNGDSIIINKWLADDLSVDSGDTVRISWYAPDSLNKLIEKSNSFIVARIVDIKGIWADSLLMPDFPGISGSATCSEWDAGIPIQMNKIRDKDEKYWNRYRGTPKAFISYEKGKELWGNNFGLATSIRFPSRLSDAEILNSLNGSLDPAKAGFIFTDQADESEKAANEGVDFGTLFLSLGFFLILASVVLLSFAVSSYFDMKKEQIRTLFALGFKRKQIRKLLFIESAAISFIGCSVGAIAGYLVNIVITMALNSVWKGAVQTDTLKAFFTLGPLLSGFSITFLITIIFMLLKVNSYLKRLNHSVKEIHSKASTRKNLVLLFISGILAVSLFCASLFRGDNELALCFASGIFLLLTLILSFRQYFISRIYKTPDKMLVRDNLSRHYYSFNSSHAVTPILFIATGIFTVFITGANRMDTGKLRMRSSGTGGYLLWCENTIAVKEDISTARGKVALGLDTDSLSGVNFVGIKRSAGNDASCLNLNHITSPPLLGTDPADFIARKSFSFSKVIPDKTVDNPWNYLNINSGPNTIYGIADQTVLDWGLKLKPGDTLILRAENGQPLNIIIAAGLESSLFQGYVLIGKDNFTKFYPSASGSSVFLVDGDPALADTYIRVLGQLFENYGINIEKTADRLESFHEVTNTYLSVFGVFGALGMITGIGGLGFVLLRNYNQRKREFALLLATGFSFKKIRKIILSEQILILAAGIISGLISAVIATLPTIKRSQDVPWLFILIMVLIIAATGLIALFLSVRAISEQSLIESLKRE